MLETVLGIFTSGGFGAITGLIGGFMQKREQRKILELENAHAEKMMEHDISMQRLENEQAVLLVEKKIDLAQAEGEIEVDVREADAFVESVRQANKPTGNPWLDGIKTAMRPLITIVLLYFSWDIYNQLDNIIGGLEALDPEKLEDLYIYVIHAIIFLTITATTWWFASRGEKAVAAIKGMIGK